MKAGRCTAVVHESKVASAVAAHHHVVNTIDNIVAAGWPTNLKCYTM
jgi:hypothetical protein